MLSARLVFVLLCCLSGPVAADPGGRWHRGEGAPPDREAMRAMREEMRLQRMAEREALRAQGVAMPERGRPWPGAEGGPRLSPEEREALRHELRTRRHRHE